MTKLLNLPIIALAAIMLGAATAYAHPVLTETAPNADAIVAAPPAEIHLAFSEPLIAKFCGIEIKDEVGKRIETGPAAIDSKDKKQLIVPVLTSLSPGTYTVNWHAVSEDTHRVKGSYSFKVGR